MAYYYPPLENGGIQRILNFKKYLPRFGYDVDICTTTAFGKCPDDDETVLRFDDKGYELTYQGSLLSSFMIRAVRKMSIWLGIVGGAEFFWRREVLGHISDFKDVASYDFILASYPTYTNLEIGYELSKIYNVPLIVDYRDGFVYEPFKPIKLSCFSFARAKKFEKKLAERATLQIAINKPLGDYLRERYSAKTIDLPNGFDDEEVFPDSDFQLPDGFNIVFTGALGNSAVQYKLETIVSVINHNQESNFVFIGRLTHEEQIKLNHCRNVFIFSQMEREYVIPIQRKSDMLLLVSGDKPSGMHGKLFEYIFAGKPILNLGKENVAAKILNETDSGRTFHPTNLEGIKQYISDVKNHSIHFRFHNLNQYTRRVQCKQLAEVLDTITE